MPDQPLTREEPVQATASITQCTGPALRRLAEAALPWLVVNQQVINALNVYPVPDGDTGTNLVLTMQAACREIAERRDRHVGAIAHAIAHGAFMGSCGNSGVILSQLWRGFARSVADKPHFDAAGLAAAMREASDTAYKGVVKPVEGTILTVSKDVALAAEAAAAESDDLRWILERAVAAANESVARTPELLPKLKQAGVVDSGGKGLAVILEGMLRHVRGEPLDTAPIMPIRTLDLAAIGAAMDAVEPGQEWEVVVDFRPKGDLDLPVFHSRLEAMGTSIQVGSGDDLYRFHIHLLEEMHDEPIQLAKQLGTVVKVRMENLLDQMERERASRMRPLPTPILDSEQIGVVAVAPGAGFARIFADINSVAVTGGQTKNPSTEEILRAIEKVPGNRVIVLPNDENGILAAGQARDASTKQVRVVPTRTVPQGIAAMVAWNPGGELAEVAQAMAAAAERIQTGEVTTAEVTTATGTVELNGVAVHSGQIIGLRNGLLEVAGEKAPQVALELLDKMNASEPDKIITLYYGEPVAAQQANELALDIKRRFPAAEEVRVREGGQPHYHYILSTE